MKHLEEISAGWPCASRTLSILSLLSKKWEVELPEEAATVLARTDRKNGLFTRPSDSVLGARQQAFSSLSATLAATAQDPRAPPPSTSIALAQQVQPIQNYGGTSQDINGLPNVTAPQANINGQDPIDLTRTFEGYSKDPSPSDMFGGVEQLIRESQDWIYRDSVQVATGFDNWDPLIMDPLTYSNGVAPDGTTLGGIPQANLGMPMTTGDEGQMYVGDMTTTPSPNMGVGMNGNMSMAQGYPMMQWLSNADDMGTYYNEGAFYQ